MEAYYNNREVRDYIEDYITMWVGNAVEAATEAFPIPRGEDLKKLISPSEIVERIDRENSPRVLEEFKELVKYPRGFSPDATVGAFLRHMLWDGLVIPEWRRFLTIEEFEHIIQEYVEQNQKQFLRELDLYL